MIFKIMIRLNLSFIKTTYYNDFPQDERERKRERSRRSYLRGPSTQTFLFPPANLPEETGSSTPSGPDLTTQLLLCVSPITFRGTLYYFSCSIKTYVHIRLRANTQWGFHVNLNLCVCSACVYVSGLHEEPFITSPACMKTYMFHPIHLLVPLSSPRPCHKT